MCIQNIRQDISQNFYPFDRKVTSIVATSALAVTVAALALLIIADCMHWGMPAVGTLTGIAGLGVIVLLTLPCKQSRPETVPAFIRTTNRQRPTVRLREILPPQTEESTQNTITLCGLAATGDLAAFERMLESFTPIEIYALCIRNNSVKDPRITDFETSHDVGRMLLANPTFTQECSLFQHLLKMQNGPEKLDFLNAIFKKIPERIIASEEINIEILALNDTETIKNLIPKMLPVVVKTIIEKTLAPNEQNPNLTWVKEGMRVYGNGYFFTICVIQSNFSAQDKLDIVESFFRENLASCIMRTLLRADAHHTLVDYSLLHLAIAKEKVDFVQVLVQKYPQLVNIGDSQNFTPLFLALLKNNPDITVTLLNVGADPNVAVQRQHFLYKDKMRVEATQQTLLMIAACAGNQEIYTALLDAGALPSIKDGSDDDPEAKSAVFYREQYIG